MKYRKKPVIIEAIQFTYPPSEEFRVFVGANVSRIYKARGINQVGKADIETLEGTMTVIEGDWIIKGIKGEFYPCKPDIFADTYELA